MIVPNNQNGLSFRGFSDQEQASLNKRLQPANPTEFLKWVTQTLRDQRAVFEDLSSQHQTLIASQDKATKALRKLDIFASYKDMGSVGHMKDMHRNVVHKTRGVGAVLSRCKSAIDETTSSYQFVGETLRSTLADRHKKIAMQKELGLRLRDLDKEFDRCKEVITDLSSTQDNLLRSFQKMLNKLKVYIPPSMREKVSKEENLKSILNYYKNSGSPNYKEKKEVKEKVKEIGKTLGNLSFGEEEKTNFKPLLALAGGIILGHILITKIL